MFEIDFSLGLYITKDDKQKITDSLKFPRSVPSIEKVFIFSSNFIIQKINFKLKCLEIKNIFSLHAFSFLAHVGSISNLPNFFLMV